MIPADKFGHPLFVGDNVLRAYRTSTQAHLELRSIERIEDGRVYLNGSKGSYITNFACLAKIGPAYPDAFI